MRFVTKGLATAFAVLALGVPSGDAQESFFSKRYCLSGGERSGVPDCSYNTWEQCRGSASGGRYCGENPFYVEPRRGAGQQGANPKRKGQPKRSN